MKKKKNLKKFYAAAFAGFCDFVSSNGGVRFTRKLKALEEVFAAVLDDRRRVSAPAWDDAEIDTGDEGGAGIETRKGVYLSSDISFFRDFLQTLDDTGAETVLDAGSGLGRLAMQLAILRPKLKIIGIEYEEGLYQQSCHVLAEIAKKGLVGRGQIRFVRGDFNERRFSSYFQSVDAVYYYHKGTRDVGKLESTLAKNIRPGAAVIVTSHPIPGIDPFPSLVRSRKFELSATRSVWIYRRLPERDIASAPEKVLTLTRKGLLVRGGTRALRDCRRAFAEAGALLIPGFLDPGLVRGIRSDLRRSRFYERIHPGIGSESCMKLNLTTSLFYFLMNDPRLFKAVTEISGCRRIRSFEGRVYKMGPGHHDTWHNDGLGARRVGLSVNLGGGFEGGAFEMMNVRTRRLLVKIRNKRPGDAVLFKIGGPLFHRVADVRGRKPRTVFAGWFLSKSGFLSKIGKDRFPDVMKRRKAARISKPRNRDGARHFRRVEKLRREPVAVLND